ncbi:MAG: uncharacterized protein JWQ90_5396 [Hydrocarboniphaga sp.]|uniref:flagellar brake protein n=1 Tax=Hydrocarboniphaga sp. TaxID=2033016 RepID=UPI00261A0613|nr:flagellar brake protein [Hydrocarboniphaga sp.]MDB5972946.1 uncharacterized protein [Hydrocarboniphaga sp.]
MITKPLELQADSVAQLQFASEDSAMRYSARVIGQIPGVSILVTTPMQNGAARLVRVGQEFVVRCFSKDRALAFTSRTLKSNIQPYPYLHLSYPDEHEQVLLRSARRVNVQLSGQVQRTGDGVGEHWGTPQQILLSDASATGAMLQAEQSLGDVGERLRLTLQFPIERMAEQGAVVEGFIRIVYEDDPAAKRYRYGIEFTDMEPTQELVLRAYVYEQLLGADARS